MRWVERISPDLEFDHGDVGVVAEREDAFACVGGADSEVVHPSGAVEASSCLWCRAGRSAAGSALGRGRWSLRCLGGWLGRRRLGFFGCSARCGRCSL